MTDTENKQEIERLIEQVLLHAREADDSLHSPHPNTGTINLCAIGINFDNIIRICKEIDAIKARQAPTIEPDPTTVSKAMEQLRNGECLTTEEYLTLIWL